MSAMPELHQYDEADTGGQEDNTKLPSLTPTQADNPAAGEEWEEYPAATDQDIVDEVWEGQAADMSAARVENVYDYMEDADAGHQLGDPYMSGGENLPALTDRQAQENDYPNDDVFMPNESWLVDQRNEQEEDVGMSTQELIVLAEQKMREHERNAQYVEAEKCRLQLESLKRRQIQVKRGELESIQREDVKVFFSMVAQHQVDFDRTWQQKTLEHKLRADDLIEALKWKHDQQQKELYETLRKKRMPKFSVELLNIRKKQVTLARAKQYMEAERLKKKADVLEAIEIDNIRRTAKQENQLRFKALLKKQQWDRQALAEKLKVEKKCLLEAKAQDFTRLKKRLRNAESELKKTHIRQSLQAQRKLTPLYASHKPRSKDAGARLKPLNRTNSEKKRKSARDLAKHGVPGNYDTYMANEQKQPEANMA